MPHKCRPIVGFLAIILSTSGHCFNYFLNDIDYWRSSEKDSARDNATEEQKPKLQKKRKKFDWSRSLDPQNDEFFKEGNYTPPAPFMELARDPSDQNIKNWFSYIEKKNELSARLQSRVKQYLARNKKEASASREILASVAKNSIGPPMPIKRFHFRMYFESSCPYCKKMIGTLKQLQSRGFYVEIRQIDPQPRMILSLPFPVTKATKKEIKEKNINSWPVLFIADRKKNVVYRLNGFRTSEQVLGFIRSQ